MASSSSSSLLELSHELLHCIFTEVEPADLSALSRTCRDLHAYIRGNKLLHKDLYIRRYDQPGPETDLSWEDALHNLIKLDRILSSEERAVKYEHLGFVAEQINQMLEYTKPDVETSANIRLLADHFADTTNIDAFLCASGLFERAGGEYQTAAHTEELRQASARLHCMYGVPIDELPSRSSFHIYRPDVHLSPSRCTRQQSKPYLTHTFARAKVYDLRQYTDDTLWGPFRDDGSLRVDWEKVEAIMIVLGFNLRKFTERSDGRFPLIWDEPFVGATPRSFVNPGPAPCPSEEKEVDEDMLKIRSLALNLDAQDPYGVSGTWMRVVCFLDYNDLYAFNFSNADFPKDQPREPIDTEEAIRLIRVKWQVTKIEPPGSYNEDDDETGGTIEDWSQFKGTRLPVVYFQGTSKSLHASWDPNANSKIRGSVRQTPEGEIRWTTFSIFHGEERWRSEGIQIGGLRSARGVLGNWFDKDYDTHGPAGPTAFWKETDELEEEKTMGNRMPFAFY